MKFRQYFSSIFYYFLTITISCVIPIYVIAEDNEYYRTWELKHSGDYKLIWYYKTQRDYANNQPNKVLVRDREFLIQSYVRPPTINGIYLLEHSKVNEGEEVLDIGTGSGIHAVFAADKAKHVVATDIYAPAVENARVNAKLHGVEDKIDFRVGDLFAPINEDEKFDVFYININFPFSVNDKERKKLHERIFSEIGNYMKPDARIYFQTSYVKNIPYIYDMLHRNNFRIMEMHMEYFKSFGHEPLFLMVQSRDEHPDETSGVGAN